MTKATVKKAISAIERHGALLVFPINNQKDPLSLWHIFHPKTKMDWDWSASGNNAVPQLWHLRVELSESDDVVYTKWFRNRAIFFSKKLFTAILSFYSQQNDIEKSLSPTAKEIYAMLLEDSPLPAKKLRKRIYEEFGTQLTASELEKGVRELFSKLLIVGYGEVDEGAFPSLAIGATRTLFEDLWDASLLIGPSVRDGIVERYFATGSAFHTYVKKKIYTLIDSHPS